MNVGIVIMLVGVAIICISAAVACFGMAGALGRVQDAIEDKEAER